MGKEGFSLAEGTLGAQGCVRLAARVVCGEDFWVMNSGIPHAANRHHRDATAGGATFLVLHVWDSGRAPTRNLSSAVIRLLI